MSVYYVNRAGAPLDGSAVCVGKRGSDKVRGQVRLTDCSVVNDEQRRNVGDNGCFGLGARPDFETIGAPRSEHHLLDPLGFPPCNIDKFTVMPNRFPQIHRYAASADEELIADEDSTWRIIRYALPPSNAVRLALS